MTNITNKDLKAWILSKYWLLRYAESFRNQRGFLQSSGLFRLFALGDLSELHISCLDVLLYILALQDMSTSLETAINERHGKIENHAGVGPTLTCWAPINYKWVCLLIKHNLPCKITTWVVNPPFSNTPKYLFMVGYSGYEYNYNHNHHKSL